MWHFHKVPLNSHWSCVSTVCSHTVAAGSSHNFTHIKVLSPPNKPDSISGCLIDGFVCYQSEQLSAEEASICHPCCVSRYICLGVNTPCAWWNWFTQEGTSIWKKANSTSPNVSRVSFYIVNEVIYIYINNEMKGTAPCTVRSEEHKWNMSTTSRACSSEKLFFKLDSSLTTSCSNWQLQSEEGCQPHPTHHEDVQASLWFDPI